MTQPHRPLSALLSQVLIAYTLDFDEAFRAMPATGSGEPPPSLAMWANVLRFVDGNGVASKALPSLSGIAKPAVKSMLDCLERHGWIEIDSGGIVRCTPAAEAARRCYEDTHAAVQRAWQERYGNDALAALHAALEALSERLDALPEYPMPTPHRGALPLGN